MMMMVYYSACAYRGKKTVTCLSRVVQATDLKQEKSCYKHKH